MELILQSLGCYLAQKAKSCWEQHQGGRQMEGSWWLHCYCNIRQIDSVEEVVVVFFWGVGGKVNGMRSLLSSFSELWLIILYVIACVVFYMVCLCVSQERIQEDVPALPGVCGQHVAAIIASVVGQPPDLALLASVTDFLLQLHPPTTRFINYAPSAFYLHPVWRMFAKLVIALFIH